MPKGTSTKKVGIKDVARLANVSPSTVSRVFNNDPKAAQIPQSTQQRIWEAAQELGYVANIAARHLRLGYEFPSIGIFFLHGLQRLLNEPFFWSLVDPICQVLAENGFPIVHLDSRSLSYPHLEKHVVLRELARGVITVGHITEELAEILWKCERPIVCVLPHSDRELPGTIIETDDECGIRMAVDFLANLHHRRIAFLTGSSKDLEHPSFRRRRVAAAEYCRQLGLDYLEVSVPDWSRVTRDGAIHHDEQAAIMKAVDGVTAVLAANDFIAAWLINAANLCGRKVPQDLSVIGFDDISLAQLVHPPLTTVRIPTKELGHLAAQSCLLMLKGDKEVPKKHSIEVSLVIRRSCLALNRNE